MNEKRIYSNYKRSNKYLGIIDYRSLVFLAIYLVILWYGINLFNISIDIKIYLFMFLSIPFIVFLYVNNNSDTAIDVIYNIFKFIFKSKIYVDCKDTNINLYGKYIKNI